MNSLTKVAALTAALISGETAMAASPEENIKVVQDFFAAYGTGDLEGIAAVMDANVKWYIPGRHPLSGTKIGRDEVRAFFEQLAQPDFRLNQSISERTRPMWLISTVAGRTQMANRMSIPHGPSSIGSRMARSSKQPTCPPIRMQQTRFSGPNTRWLRSLSDWPNKRSTGVSSARLPRNPQFHRRLVCPV